MNQAITRCLDRPGHCDPVLESILFGEVIFRKIKGELFAKRAILVRSPHEQTIAEFSAIYGTNNKSIIVAAPVIPVTVDYSRVKGGKAYLEADGKIIELHYPIANLGLVFGEEDFKIYQDLLREKGLVN